MPDPLIKERLELILEHAEVIIKRMLAVPDAGWFVSDGDGQLMYDSLITRLQAIAENIKKIERLAPGFTNQQLMLNAGNIIRFRDLAAHHYELLDYQVIFLICKKDIPELLQKILAYFNSSGNGSN